MKIQELQRLFDYNYWAHRRVWDCVLTLTDEQFTRPSDYSIGSVHQQIVHTMEVEALMFARANGASPSALPAASDYPTRDSIRARWDTIETGWRAYLPTLDDAQLEQPVQYVSLTGNQSRTNRRWELLMQCLNHSTDHRAQTLAIIHQVGGKTIAQDWIFYTWEAAL